MSDKEGWVFLHNARKAHYIVEGQSLCGKWMYLGTTGLELPDESSPDDCVICTRKLKKRLENE